MAMINKLVSYAIDSVMNLILTRYYNRVALYHTSKLDESIFLKWVIRNKSEFYVKCEMRLWQLGTNEIWISFNAAK